MTFPYPFDFNWIKGCQNWFYFQWKQWMRVQCCFRSRCIRYMHIITDHFKRADTHHCDSFHSLLFSRKIYSLKMSQFTSYCVQCKHSIAENSDHLFWFKNHFFNILCLEKFNCEQMDRPCVQCKSPISFVAAATTSAAERNVLMLKSSHSNSTFCNLKCLHQYQDKHVRCAYCSIEVNANNQSPSLANCQEIVKFCSLDCELRTNIHVNMESMTLAKCSNCNQLKTIEMGLFVDDVQYVACSEDCFMELERKNAVENGE